MSRDTFTITVRAEGTGPEGALRVRRFLKCALRGYGLRCIAVQQVAATIAIPHQTHQEREEGAGAATDTPKAPACELSQPAGICAPQTDLDRQTEDASGARGPAAVASLPSPATTLEQVL